MGPKTRAEIQRAYRQRQKERVQENIPKVRKTRAEIQKAYRERQKQKGSEFKEKENERKKNAYAPTVLLDDATLEARRQRNREYATRFRKKKGLAKKNVLENDDGSSHASDTQDQDAERVIVKFDFQRAKTRKRISRAVSKANRKIQNLESERSILQRQIWKLKKRISTSKKKDQAGADKKKARNASRKSKSPTTPRSRANAILRKAGMSPRTTPPIVKKQLVFAEAMAQEVQVASTSAGPQRKTVRKGLAASIVSGAIIRKYRAMSALSKATKISRKVLIKSKRKLTHSRKIRERERQQHVDESIKAFLERDDNSRMMPGKADFVTISKGVKVQKRYLNDYLHNLHQKFVAENPQLRISRANFCERPKHVIPTSFSSRYTCLCQYHQNMALKLKAIKGCGAAIPTNPDTFIKSEEGRIPEIVQQLPENIKFSQWKRVEVEDGKKKTKLVSFEEDRQTFSENFKENIKKFKDKGTVL